MAWKVRAFTVVVAAAAIAVAALWFSQRRWTVVRELLPPRGYFEAIDQQQISLAPGEQATISVVPRYRGKYHVLLRLPPESDWLPELERSRLELRFGPPKEDGVTKSLALSRAQRFSDPQGRGYIVARLTVPEDLAERVEAMITLAVIDLEPRSGGLVEPATLEVRKASDL